MKNFTAQFISFTIAVSIFVTPASAFAWNTHDGHHGDSPSECIWAGSGWYAQYFDYSVKHPDMNLPTSAWSTYNGDPHSKAGTWSKDWYESKYAVQTQTDPNLEFGGNFFPLDSIATSSEITNGHNYHFGAIWRASVVAPADDTYHYDLTSDDDVWVYVNDELAVDNQGVHSATSKSGDLTLAEGNNKIEIYFAERHVTESHMYFKLSDTSLEIHPLSPKSCVPPSTPPPPPAAINTSPTVTLLGVNPFIVATGTSFIDPGATATDTEDGNLTSKIVVSGSVNASTTGTYTLTYSVTDSGGLGATTTRSVIINATNTASTTTSPAASPTPPPANTGGGGSSSSGGGSSSSSGSSGSSSGGEAVGRHSHDISDLLARPISGGVGQVLGASTQCAYLRDYLRRDWDNDKIEMLKLQSFLNTFESEHLTLNSIFDQDTFDAVSRFQNKYFDDILKPWGHTAPTSFVYILTKKKINEIYCKTTINLTDAQKQEIAEFHAYLESLKNNPVDVSVDVGNNNSKTIVSPVKKDQSLAGSIASSVASTVASVTNNTKLRNLAVSLFGTPKGLGQISSTYLLILLAIILLAVFWPTPKAGGKGSIMVLEKHPKNPVKTQSTEPIEMPSASIGSEIPPESVHAEENKIIEDKKDDDDTPPSIFNNPGNSGNSSSGQGFKGIIG